MRDLSGDSYSAIVRRSQQSLIEFLHAELDLAFTFVQTALLETGSDNDHANAAMEKAAAALDTIRRFQGRIEDPAEWRKLNDRVAELESLLARNPKIVVQFEGERRRAQSDAAGALSGSFGRRSRQYSGRAQPDHYPHQRGDVTVRNILVDPARNAAMERSAAPSRSKPRRPPGTLSGCDNRFVIAPQSAPGIRSATGHRNTAEDCRPFMVLVSGTHGAILRGLPVTAGCSDCHSRVRCSEACSVSDCSIFASWRLIRSR
jgi:hypothetical protein